MAGENSWIAECLAQFTRSPVWLTPINDFIDEYCAVFNNDDEMKLEYTTIHHSFQQLIDRLLTDFIQEIGVGMETAMETLRHSMDDRTGPGGVATHRVLKYIFYVDDFRTFHRMMVRRNLELDIIATKALKDSGALPADPLTTTADAATEARTAAMLAKMVMDFNNNVHEDEALSLAIQESLKDTTLRRKSVELIDAQLQESLAVEIQKVEQVMVTDAKTGSAVSAVPEAIQELKKTEQIQQLNEQTLRAREENIKNCPVLSNEAAACETATAIAAANMNVALPSPTRTAPSPLVASAVGSQATAPTTISPVAAPTSVSPVSASSKRETVKSFGKIGLPALPPISQPTFEALASPTPAAKVAVTQPTASPCKQPLPTKEEMEKRAQYMREQREKILQMGKANRRRELEDYARENNVPVSMQTNDESTQAAKQLTVDIARRLREDILGEARKRS